MSCGIQSTCVGENPTLNIHLIGDSRDAILPDELSAEIDFRYSSSRARCSPFTKLFTHLHLLQGALFPGFQQNSVTAFLKCIVPRSTPISSPSCCFYHFNLYINYKPIYLFIIYFFISYQVKFVNESDKDSMIISPLNPEWSLGVSKYCLDKKDFKIKSWLKKWFNNQP